MSQSPRVVVIGGVNGAGKSTAARELLHSLKIDVFANADVIASGLNSLNPEAEAFRAGRMLLEWINELAANRCDFAFETTLASRTYAPWLRSLKQCGYRVTLIYYWLASPEVAIARVRQRVLSGGHAIPDADVRRRYPRSVRNFLELYRPIADEWEVYDNTNSRRLLMAQGHKEKQVVHSTQDWELFVRSQDDGG
jgi:predicted ABC-type ATPase